MKKSILLYVFLVAELAVIILLCFQNGKLKDAQVNIDIPLNGLNDKYLSPGFDVESDDKKELDDKIIIYDNGIDTIEYPYIDAPLNDYDFENLTVDEMKKKMYYKDGQKAATFGIDVSQHQGNIDWNRVKADGVEFAIIRAGYRGYETGVIHQDSKFLENIRGAQEVGIDIGVYFYSQAINEVEAQEEADFVLGLLSENEITPVYPVVFDWEFVGDEDPARTDNLSPELMNKCCVTFCNAIKNAGYTPMYYTVVKDALFKYDLTELAEYDMWLAEYCRATEFIYDFKMWQYSCSGVIDGIDALVDLNLYFE